MKALARLLYALVLTVAFSVEAVEPSLADAVAKGDHVNIKRLLAAGGNPNAFIFAPDPDTPRRKKAVSLLELAAQAGDVELCTLLLTLGGAVNLHLDGSSPLHAAARAGRTDTARLLLSAGANPDIANADGNGALLVAVQNGDLAMVRLLLEAGADRNNAHILLKGAGMRKEVTITPLIASLEARRPDISQALLDAGADINFLVLNPGSRWFYNALGFAIYRGNTEQAVFLIERGASLDPSAMNAQTMGKEFDMQIPLAQAFANGDASMVKLLVERGANIFAKTRSGMTIPHILAAQPDPELNMGTALRWLVEQGVPIDLKNNNGMTPLALAAMANHLGTARELLALGASPEAALPYATQHPDMTRLLLDARKR